MDPPVFAKKSAPPPPIPEDIRDRGAEIGGQEPPRTGQGAGTFPTFPSPSRCSTPSSSILNSSNDNTRNTTRDEPMDQDAQPDPQQPLGKGKENAAASGVSTPKKKGRNRSRAKKNSTKKNAGEQAPNIEQLLAGLEPQHPPGKQGDTDGNDVDDNPLKGKKPSYDKTKNSSVFAAALERDSHNPIPPPLPPPYPTDPPAQPPPLPPPPPSADMENIQAEGQGNSNDIHETRTDAANVNKTTKAGRPRQASGRGKSGTSQRTLGRIPKITPALATGAQDGTASSNQSSTAQDQQQQQQQNTGNSSNGNSKDVPPAQTGSYAHRQGNQGSSPPAVCLDVTSHRFLPEDEKRVDILRRKMVGDPPLATPDSQLTTYHDFPTVFSHEVTGIPLDEAPGADGACQTNDTRFVVLAEFATVDRPDTTAYHTILKREAITFLLVYRPAQTRGKKRWDFPPLSFCQDFINDLLSKMFAEDLPGSTAYARTGKWGLVQTIVLHSGDMEALEEFRRYVSLWQYKDHSFDTFPRDVALAKPELSILLRASMKTFQTDIIPKVLFNRNKTVLAGSLRVVSTTFFRNTDISHKGESKEYWRSIDLKGDEQLLRCLRFLPESRPLLLGYDAVQIRGGLRPQEILPMSGHKRPWSEFAPAASPLLQDPRSAHGPAPDFNPPNSSDPTQRGGKRGRPFRGGRRGRFQRKI